MIPLRDDTPRFHTPYVTWFLLGLNSVVFLFELSLPPQARNALMYQFGEIPVVLTAWLHRVPQVSFVMATLPILTSMFLHASWGHLLANMWVLWIFGDNIEDYLGHFKYLVFYFLCGVAASLFHVLLNANSQVPSVGASGAIAGVMGAYFVLYPRASVFSYFPPIFFFWIPAWLVLGYWFVAQFLSGAATSIAYAHQTSGGAGIAFWAHVGGFLAGVALVKIFPGQTRRYRFYA